jgi:ABC-2 type transport system permease protein
MTAGLLQKARACFVRDARIDASYRVSFVLDAVDGLLMVVAYTMLARMFGSARPDGFDPLGFLLVGIAVNGALMTAQTCFAQAIRGAHAAGTIKAVMVTPTPPLTVVTLASVYPVARAMMDVVIWLAGAWMCGVSMAQANLGTAAVVFVLATLAVAGFGFLSAAFAVVFKRGDPILWMFGALTLLLGGVLYPTSALPPWLGALSAGLPVTHALQAMRAVLLDGASLAHVAEELLHLAAFAVVGIPAGLAVLAGALGVAQQRGSLGHG